MVQMRQSAWRSGKIHWWLGGALLTLALAVGIGLYVLFPLFKQPFEQANEWPPFRAEDGWQKSPAGNLYFSDEPEEIAPGVTCQRTIVIDKKSKTDSQHVFGRYLVKIEVAEDAEPNAEFTDVIHKRIAEHVDQLAFHIVDAKRLAEVDNIVDEEWQDVPARSVRELEAEGMVRVVEEDPVLLWIFRGGAALFFADIIFDKGSVLPFYTRTSGAFSSSRGDLVEFAKSRIGSYCAQIHRSAARNKIPPRLLEAVILNELDDYDYLDQAQELIYTGAGRSHGEVQLQVDRLLNHGLIDIAKSPTDKIRDPAVDISYEDFKGKSQFRLNWLICERIQRYDSGIEFAAREIAYLLKMLEPGSPLLKNPWPQALLVDPAQGISLDRVYDNLKVDTLAAKPVNEQREKERTLALLVASAYNGGGAIYDFKDVKQLFPEQVPYAWAQTSPETTGMQQPRLHGCNAMIMAEVLFDHPEICPIILKPGKYRGKLVDIAQIRAKRKFAEKEGAGYTIEATPIEVHLHADDKLDFVGAAQIVERWRFSNRYTGPFAEAFFSLTQADYTRTINANSGRKARRIGPQKIIGETQVVDLFDTDGVLEPPGFESGAPFKPKPANMELTWILEVDQTNGRVYLELATESYQQAQVLQYNPNPVFQYHFVYEMEYLDDDGK